MDDCRFVGCEGKNAYTEDSSKACQKSHFKVHKKECAALSEERQILLNGRKEAKQEINAMRTLARHQEAVDMGLVREEREPGFVREFGEGEDPEVLGQGVDSRNALSFEAAMKEGLIVQYYENRDDDEQGHGERTLIFFPAQQGEDNAPQGDRQEEENALDNAEPRIVELVDEDEEEVTDNA